MKNKKLFMISIIACLIPLLINALFYNQLPDQIPTHWNAAGEVDDYSNKVFALFILPILLVALQIFTIWVMDKDPKRRNIPDVMYRLMYFIMPVLSIFICAFTINASLPNGIDLNITTFMPILIGLLFLAIANYLPKCKQSYTVGIKTPWALDDEENWNKTHRLAGFLWMIGAFLIMVAVFLPTNMIAAYTLVIVLAMAFIPYVYSYLIYRRKKGK